MTLILISNIALCTLIFGAILAGSVWAILATRRDQQRLGQLRTAATDGGAGVLTVETRPTIESRPPVAPRRPEAAPARSGRQAAFAA